MAKPSSLKSTPKRSPRSGRDAGGSKAKGSQGRGKDAGSPDAGASGERELSFGREISGLALLALVTLSAIAVIGEFATRGAGNWLGPYVGTFWARQLTQAFGNFPVLLFLAMGVLGGFILVSGRPLWRIFAVLGLIGLVVQLFLSVRHLGGPLSVSPGMGGLVGLRSDIASAPEVFRSSGGWIGNFLAQSLFYPVFGARHLGPYLITGFTFLILTVWGFRLSVRALVERSAGAAGHLSRLLQHSWSRGRAAADAKRQEAEAAEAAAIAAAAQGADASEAAATEAALREGSVRATARKSRRKSQASLRDGAEASATALVDAPDEPVQDAGMELPQEFLEDLDDDELETLRALQAGVDPRKLDPLIVRKLRDLDRERKRVAELNDWEHKAANPEIGGLLGRKRGSLDLGLAAGGTEAEPESDGLAGSAAEEEGEVEDPAATPATPRSRLEKGRRRKKKQFEEDSAELRRTVSTAEPDGTAETDAPPEVAEETGAAFSDAAEDGESVGSEAAVGRKKEVVYDPYVLPELDSIFPAVPEQPLEFTEDELREQSRLLEAQLNNFKVMGKVVQICPGPVITRYEVELAPGVKVNRISNLADDLALALRAKSIRILAPIPGKSVVGIEVPNRKAQIVYIKEILASSAFANEEDTLKIGLGKTISGEPYAMDLARAPHLLIAGQTGSGKSVCINTIMASLLLSRTPDELRMILVDPKVVELKPYDAIPHLLHPVVTQPDVAVQALKWATVEMDRRYEVLAQCGVRNIKGFNQKFREGRLAEDLDPEDKKLMPFIVIVIDELADLMMVAGKEVETNIARIAQKARAVGIHLILATQRPSTNVITGTIKANLPTRIAFKVASQIDARTILDKQGAEKLLGRGDMLFRPVDFPEPLRLHGCFLDDEQCEQLALACSEQFVNYPQVATFSLEDESGVGADDDEPRDEKFREAAELVVQLKQASVSLLQRRLGLGYARSGRLVDQLERAGIVGRERGSKPREVLMDADELHSFLSSGLND